MTWTPGVDTLLRAGLFAPPSGTGSSEAPETPITVGVPKPRGGKPGNAGTCHKSPYSTTHRSSSGPSSRGPGTAAARATARTPTGLDCPRRFVKTLEADLAQDLVRQRDVDRAPARRDHRRQPARRRRAF